MLLVEDLLLLTMYQALSGIASTAISVCSIIAGDVNKPIKVVLISARSSDSLQFVEFISVCFVIVMVLSDVYPALFKPIH